MRAALLLFASTMLAMPATAQDCPDGLRIFEHEMGIACIPMAPQRIIATRGDSLATPLLDIGAPLVGAGFREMEDGTPWIRGATDIFGDVFVEAAGLASVGAPNQADIEAVAALAPDLIFIRAFEAERLPQFEAIAPTVVVPGDLPYLDHMAFLADAAGLADTYEARIAAYRARIDTARDVIGSPEEITVSRLDVEDGGLWYYPNWGAIDQVIDDIGFAKPAIQAEAPPDGFNNLSAERIMAFDGDVILTSSAPRFGQTIAMKTEQFDTVAPFWDQLAGVRSGNLFWYERDIYVGYTFESLDRSIDLLTTITAGRDFD
ncbi:MAG: ABC transporter substrate-binding protein [Pseudomonadota bacterium]